MSKNKGNGGEREVSKLILPWWKQVEPLTEKGKPIQMVRTPGSGGWVYGPDFDVCGDLVTNAKRFPFSVEVKREEAWKLQVLIDCKPSPVWGFWRQCQRDARVVNREPMLWFRQNRRPWFVMMRKRYVSAIKMTVPDVVFPNRLRLMVDCETVPVMYLASKLLAHDPSLFAIGEPCCN